MEDELIRLTTFLLAFRGVRRIIRIPGTKDEWENDAEHSYHLAMLCLYILDLNPESGLDRGQVLELALTHDLVETYAGDTFFHRTPAANKEKKNSEAKAAERIAYEFPLFPSLHASIAEYEEPSSRESRFVYAVDKLAPIVMVYLDRGRIWHEYDISFEKLAADKSQKIESVPEVSSHLRSLLALLETEPELFPSASPPSTAPASPDSSY